MEPEKREARIDKWLWAVRLFKTRSISADACKKGHIMLNKRQVKPSRTVKSGDTVSVKKGPITYSFIVVQAIEKRVGAKLVPEMMRNVTSPEQYELLEMSKLSGFIDRSNGTGRPTKKDRRSMDDFKDFPFLLDDDDDDDEV
ncbi:MAG: RNA-binding S4 domain-containing protein [Bacteroidaceae bacterium]